MKDSKEHASIRRSTIYDVDMTISEVEIPFELNRTCFLCDVDMTISEVKIPFERKQSEGIEVFMPQSGAFQREHSTTCEISITN